MGSLYWRDPSDVSTAAGWFIHYKGLDGRWHTKSLKGRNTKADERKAAAKLDEVERKVERGEDPFPPPAPAPVAELTFGELAEKWRAALTNRSAREDGYRLDGHVLPKLGKLPLSAVTTECLMEWLDEQRTAKDGLADGSIRHNLNLVSRVFAFGIERGKVPGKVNPVRLIPVGKRPTQAVKRDRPWLDDDATVRLLVNGMPEPFGLMFYLGNQCGLRTGELCGLRLSDLAGLDRGSIRVRFSYDGPLKEDKRGEGKCKWAPAPADAKAVLGPLVARREAEGAGPEDFVFVTAKSDRWPGGQMFQRAVIEDAWDRAVGRGAAEGEKRERKGKHGPQPKDPPKPVVRLDLTWYEATRHSFVSRNLSRGASLDEVSAAVGHANVTTTRRYYDHFVRRTFSPTLTAGLGLGSPGDADVLPLKGRKGKGRA